MYKKVKTQNFFFSLLVINLLPIAVSAQCAMCRASLQGEDNITKAKAVNDGIIYLMAIPYILVGIMAIVIYKMYRSKK